MARAIAFFVFILVFPMGVFAHSFIYFKFPAEAVGWEEDFVGDIDDESRTITFTTQRWIENISQLRAVFMLDGYYEVKVGETVQASGYTKNDFRKDVVYTINDRVSYTVKFISPQASGIPVIKIDTQDGAEILNKEDWINMTFALSDPNNSDNDIPAISNQQIRGRGNGSWAYPKKPYRIKFRTGQEQSLFGLPAARNWVLLAEYIDPTSIKTSVAFELGKSIFELPFTCSYHHVQLYLNGKYNGIYVLTELRQADPAGVGAPCRVKVDSVEGWLVELDAYYDEEPKFITTNYNLPIMIKSSSFKPVNMENQAYSFIRDDWNELCDSLASENFPENGYRDLINMSSFVDYIMMHEIVLNHELEHPKSVFSYKDKGGKINMGPLWDFDWTFGFHHSKSDEHLYFLAPRMYSLKHSFFQRFFEDPIFLVKYKERWNEKYEEIADAAGFMETLGKKIRTAVTEDTKRWYFPGGYHNDYDPDHVRQIKNMVTWWNDRQPWLNTELNKVEVLPASKNFGTTGYDYLEISPQTFTLVAFGKMSNLSANLQKGNLSDFETSIDLNQAPTEKGGYLATVSVKPKNSLPIDTYSDMLILNGENQGNAFSLEVPLSFAVTSETPIRQPQIAISNIRANVIGNIIVFENLPPKAKIEVYNLQGKHIYSANPENPKILKIEVQTKGVYITRISFGNERKTLKVLVR